MSSINQVAVSGRATRDPELKEIGNDNYVVNVGIAVERTVKQGEEYVQVPNFFDVAVFGNYAKLINAKLRKGDQLFVSGELRYESWENEAGEKRSKVSIVAKALDGAFAFRKADGSDTPARADGDAPVAATGPLSTDDDLPF